jgi:hypothetical protein
VPLRARLFCARAASWHRALVDTAPLTARTTAQRHCQPPSACCAP